MQRMLRKLLKLLKRNVRRRKHVRRCADRVPHWRRRHGLRMLLLDILRRLQRHLRLVDNLLLLGLGLGLRLRLGLELGLSLHLKLRRLLLKLRLRRRLIRCLRLLLRT